MGTRLRVNKPRSFQHTVIEQANGYKKNIVLRQSNVLYSRYGRFRGVGISWQFEVVSIYNKTSK